MGGEVGQPTKREECRGLLILHPKASLPRGNGVALEGAEGIPARPKWAQRRLPVVVLDGPAEVIHGGLEPGIGLSRGRVRGPAPLFLRGLVMEGE